MMNESITPELRSEVSARLTATHDDIRRVFGQEEVTLSGPEMEALLIGVWLMGYGSAVGDQMDYGTILESPIGQAGKRALGL